MTQFKEQQGFLTIAQNNESTDYLELAYLQAKSVKATQKINSYAVIVDEATSKLVTERHRQVIDYVIVLKQDDAQDDAWKLKNEWQVFTLTPFKETIKLESDLLLTRSIDHWWTAFRLRPMCFSHRCRDHRQEVVEETPYRKFFRDNGLPDLYNGLYYFRYTKETADFFGLARKLFQNWESITPSLIRAHGSKPTTDAVFALTAKILGEENYYVPTLDFVNFVHMKSGIQGWSDNQPWTDYAMVEQDQSRVRINNINQLWPVHYHEKDINWNG